jgi:hypothetical protein
MALYHHSSIRLNGVSVIFPSARVSQVVSFLEVFQKLWIHFSLPSLFNHELWGKSKTYEARIHVLFSMLVLLRLSQIETYSMAVYPCSTTPLVRYLTYILAK